MIIRLKTKVNTNGNSYGLIINTERKQYRRGYGIVSYGADFTVSKRDIDDYIKYALKAANYKEV